MEMYPSEVGNAVKGLSDFSHASVSQVLMPFGTATYGNVHNSSLLKWRQYVLLWITLVELNLTEKKRQK